jgi:hypothetical protein
MKLRIIPLLLAVSALGFADGNTANTSVNAGVQLITPISVTKVQDLSFGTLVIDPTHFVPGSMKINGNGAVTTSFNGGTWISTSTGTTLQPKAAQFLVQGESTYPFGFAAAGFNVIHPSGAAWWVLPDVILDGMVTTGNIPLTVNVGATLTIGNSIRGIYTGTMTATVTYL